MFQSESVEFVCTQCNKKYSKKIGWLKSHTKFDCTCGTTIRLDSKELHAKISGIEKNFRNLFK